MHPQSRDNFTSYDRNIELNGNASCESGVRRIERLRTMVARAKGRVEEQQAFNVQGTNLSNRKCDQQTYSTYRNDEIISDKSFVNGHE